jgi:hypothetical protein
MPTAIRPPTHAQVGKATFEKVAAGGRFGKTVHLTKPQLEAFETQLERLAKTNPQRASELLQCTLDLFGEGTLRLDVGPDEYRYSKRNLIASFANDVVAAIRKADPTVSTPAPMPLAR